MYVFSLSFPRIEYISFFYEKAFSYSSSSSSLYTKLVKGFLHSKTPLSPLMIDFDFIMKETPSVSFFFARLGVFFESSGGRHPM